MGNGNSFLNNRPTTKKLYTTFMVTIFGGEWHDHAIGSETQPPTIYLLTLKSGGNTINSAQLL